jgi:SAM-dependent methyltransferase
MQRDQYFIRGGVKGRERLRILGRVMRPTTLSLFERVGICAGMSILDAGCGGGEVTLELARLTGPEGSVVGWDLDETKLELARRDAEEMGFGNVEYKLADIRQREARSEFDVVYTRFLLTHLRDPEEAVAKLSQAARPGGIVIIEDIDLGGIFCHPFSTAFQRFLDIYLEASQLNGGDPNIGLRLPGLLIDAGLENIQTNVVQPAGIVGEVKLLCAVTMESIADSVVADRLAGEAEVERVIEGLYELAHDKRSFVSHPRVVQVSACRL